ncbi:response regulator [uncultured Ferrovibrio sp.]|jgi:two-component system chemotaxis response regulator CheY|uniref:response regulator n=1 Tax=uncultured Ferrovibrio sp. TaxID=1576913 RepID=UPI002637688A|nr:response regulator [uncultured Ferrovibrio sp.]
MTEILLVDDDVNVRRALSLQLQDAGYDVREAPNGQVALAMLRQQLSDVILTDIYMPDGDGLELISQLRTFTQTPVIAMSGGGVYDNPLKMLPVAEVLGACRVLQKPFTQETLIEAIGDALHPKQAEPDM